MILSHIFRVTSVKSNTGDFKSSNSRLNASVTAFRKGVNLFLRTNNCLESSCGKNVIYSHSSNNQQHALPSKPSKVSRVLIFPCCSRKSSRDIRPKEKRSFEPLSYVLGPAYIGVPPGHHEPAVPQSAK